MNNIYVNGDSSNISKINGLFRLIDRTLPVFVAEPIISQIRAFSANITWETDELTTGLIVYNEIGSNQDTIRIVTPTAEVSYNLTNLSPISEYQIKAAITDTSGNGPVWSEQQQFSTTGGNEVDVMLPDTAIAIGDTILYPIFLKTASSIPITKYQFNLVFNSNLLEFQNTNHPTSLTDSWSSPTVNVINDSLILTHSSTQGITQIGTLLFLRFFVRKQVQHEQQIPLRFQ